MAEKNNKEKDVLLRSREIDEIIGKPPHWLIRWGIGIFFFVLTLVLVLSAFVRYPETITTPFKLALTKPAEPLVSQADGKLLKLFVKEGSHVHKNDTLFFEKTNSDYNAVQQYISTAPVEGTVNFISPLQENQTVTKNQLLFYIIPTGTSSQATIYVHETEAAKLKPGQKIILKLTGYPFQEYGSVQAVIDYISDASVDSLYYVKAILPEGLKTNYGKNISYKEGLSGSAEIIIKDQRLIEKLIGNKKGW
jgi:multidrug resistance efflux pump